MPSDARHERLTAWPVGFAHGSENREALLVLASLAGLLPRSLAETARSEGSASGCLRAVRAGDLGSEADREMADAIDPREVSASVARCGARFVAPGDDEYVIGLEHLADPPAALFVRGRSLVELEPRVAVVGARNCSALGRDVAAELGFGLASAGVTSSLVSSERAVWEALGSPSLPEQLARQTGLNLGDVLSVLIDLELRGLVRTVGGRVERRLAAAGPLRTPR